MSGAGMTSAECQITREIDQTTGKSTCTIDTAMTTPSLGTAPDPDEVATWTWVSRTFFHETLPDAWRWVYPNTPGWGAESFPAIFDGSSTYNGDTPSSSYPNNMTDCRYTANSTPATFVVELPWYWDWYEKTVGEGEGAYTIGMGVPHYKSLTVVQTCTKSEQATGDAQWAAARGRCLAKDYGATTPGYISGIQVKDLYNSVDGCNRGFRVSDCQAMNAGKGKFEGYFLSVCEYYHVDGEATTCTTVFDADELLPDEGTPVFPAGAVIGTPCNVAYYLFGINCVCAP